MSQLCASGEEVTNSSLWRSDLGMRLIGCGEVNTRLRPYDNSSC